MSMWGHVPGGPETSTAGMVDKTSLSTLASTALLLEPAVG